MAISDDLMQRLRKKAQETVSRTRSGTEFHQLRTGTNRIRIVWDTSRFDQPWFEQARHRQVGPQSSMFICPKMTFAKPCPICEAIVELKKGGKDDVAMATLLKAKTSISFNILDVNNTDPVNPKYPLSTVVWTTFPGVFEDIVAIINNPLFGNIFDPKVGRDLFIELTDKSASGTGFNEYKVQACPERTEIPAEAVQSCADLSRFAKEEPYNKIRAALYGEHYEPEAGEEELNRSFPSSSNGAAVRAEAPVAQPVQAPVQAPPPQAPVPAPQPVPAQPALAPERVAKEPAPISPPTPIPTAAAPSSAPPSAKLDIKDQLRRLRERQQSKPS